MGSGSGAEHVNGPNDGNIQSADGDSGGGDGAGSGGDENRPGNGGNDGGGGGGEGRGGNDGRGRDPSQQIKRMYSHIRSVIGRGTDLTTTDNAKCLLHIMPTTSISRTYMTTRFTSQQAKVDPRRVRQCRDNVRFMASRLQDAHEYARQVYDSEHGGGGVTAHMPNAQSFPEPETQEFTAAETAWVMEQATQEAEPEGGGENGDTDGEGAESDRDARVRAARTPRPPLVLPPSSAAQGYRVMDSLPLEHCLLNDFEMIERIPDQHADQWASALSRAYGDAVRLATEGGDATELDRVLKLTLILPQLLLRRASRGGTQATMVIGKRFVLVDGWDIRKLVEDMLEDRAANRLRMRQAEEDDQTESRRIKAAIQLFEKAAISRGLKRLNSNGLADMREDKVLQQMLDKHPSRREDMLLHEDLGTLDSFQGLSLKRVFKKLDVTAGAGVDGVNNSYLKVLATRNYEGVHSKHVMTNISGLSNAMFNNQLPAWYAHAVGAGNLFAPLKKKNSMDARPVSCPLALTRASERAVAQATQQAVREEVLPENLGGPNNYGMHQLILGIELDLELHPDYDLQLFLDVRNAHNAFSRLKAQEAMISSNRAGVKLLAGAFTVANASEAELLYRDRNEGWEKATLSSTGGKQGSPLTGPAFRMTINDILKKASKIMRGDPVGDGEAVGGADSVTQVDGRVKAFEDDINAYGKAPAVLRAYDFLKGPDGLITVGLEVVPSKCVALIPPTANAYTGSQEDYDRLGIPKELQPRPVDPNAPDGKQLGRVWDEEEGRWMFGHIYIGAPVGEDKFKAHIVSETVAEICSNSNNNTCLLSSASRHAASTALVFSASTRFDWLMQVLPPRLTYEAAQEIDAAFQDQTITCWGSSSDDSAIYARHSSFTQIRAAQPVRRSGTGLRLLANRAHSSYLGSLNGALPRLIDARGEEGVVEKGTFPHLVDVLGDGSFDKGREARRFRTFLNSDCEMAKDFKEAHEFCKQREDWFWQRVGEAEPTLYPTTEARTAAREKMEKKRLESAMQTPIEGLGYLLSGSEVEQGKLNRAISHQFHDLVDADLRICAREMDRDDQRRIAFTAVSGSSSARAIVSGGMEASVKFTDKEWMEAVQTYMGLPSSLAEDIVGQRIKTNDPNARYFVDPYARNLQTAMGWTGDSRHFTSHMELEYMIAQSIREIKDGSIFVEQEVFNELIDSIPPGPGRDRLASLSLREIKTLGDGLVPDLAITASHELNGGTRELMDVKFLGCGNAYTQSASTTPQAVVESRQRRVNEEYRNQAHKLDIKYAGHPADAPGPGPIASALAQYPRVKGLVVGHFAEFSSDLKDLLGMIVEASATSYAESTGTPFELAMGAISWNTRRRWGMIAARANSRTKIAARAHVLGRTCLQGRRNRNCEEFGSIFNRWDTATAAVAAVADA